MSARFRISSGTPTLLLEDIDDLLASVSCQEDEIEVRTLASEFSRVCKFVDSAPEFFLITSHEGCNQRGGRLPYRSINRVVSRN